VPTTMIIAKFLCDDCDDEDCMRKRYACWVSVQNAVTMCLFLGWSSQSEDLR